MKSQTKILTVLGNIMYNFSGTINMKVYLYYTSKNIFCFRKLQL